VSEVGSFEAKNIFSALLDRAEHGEEIVITRRGKPVAKLGPLQRESHRREAEEAAAALRARAKSKKRGRFDWEEWKKYRDGGPPVSLVLDSSVALTWIYADEGDEQTERVLQLVTQSEAWVPATWRLEVAS
jgi:prevent-host-death family protein